MELNFVSFEEAIEYVAKAPHYMVFGNLCDIESHIAKYSKYFCEFHYFHLIKVDGEVVGLIIESLM